MQLCVPPTTHPSQIGTDLMDLSVGLLCSSALEGSVHIVRGVLSLKGLLSLSVTAVGRPSEQHLEHEGVKTRIPTDSRPRTPI
eukprot:1126399-Amphidinium_carterae.1